MTAVKRAAEDAGTGRPKKPATAAAAASPASIPTNKTMPSDYAFIRPAPPGCRKIVSFNVNSLAAACKKGFKEYVAAEDPDILCLQETKANQPMAFVLSSYPHKYWHCSRAKKGYSGTAVFSKTKPLGATYGFGPDADVADDEGRLITLEFDSFHLVACYVPNAGEKLVRLDRRMRWDDAMRAHLAALERSKPVVYTGDLNVAHHPVDLARPDSNKRSAGFTQEERNSFTSLLGDHRLDAFRHLHPDARADAYTYFGYRGNCRAKALGWRLDYFVVSAALMPRVVDVTVRNQCYGASDHVPLLMLLRDADPAKGPGDQPAADPAAEPAADPAAEPPKEE
ncbi:hypothetical protein GGF46_004809 [Coemansia sp. RSA 552]|nr:hypothetical protein GGF46_004809 [Coemansia sp. RSA 552]